MKNVISRILFLIGVGLVLYSFVSKILSYCVQTSTVEQHIENVANLSDEEKSDMLNSSNEYNKDISEDFKVKSLDETSSEKTYVYSELRAVGVIGTLTIPKIEVSLPIYDTTTDDNLKKGVTLLDGTSFPTGEENTHSVLAGHSGFTTAKLLDDIDKLVIGDVFEVEYLGETSVYEVIDIQVVLPDDTSSLKIQEGQTLVTLVTCTPKYLNTHRLLVTAKKVEDTQIEYTPNSKYVDFIKKNYKYIIIIVIIIILAIFGMIKLNQFIRRKAQNKKENEDK